MKFQRLLTASAALCVATVLAGCGGQSSTESNSAGAGDSSNATTSSSSTESATSLSGTGATFPALIYTRWFEEYKGAKGVQIDYDPKGSGAGIKALTDQSTDFGASDAPLNASEKGKLPSPAVTLPTVAGAVALAYNVPGAPKNLKMTSDALAGVFLGQITKWNDPKIAAANPGATLPATPITVAHRSDGSGTTYIFTNYLSAVSPEWKTKVGASKTVTWPTGLAGKGSDGVASTIKGTPGAIGYVELAFAKKGNLPYVSIKNKDGQFIAPSVEATTAAAESSSDALVKDVTAPIVNASGAKSYPIAGFTYIMAYQSAQNAKKGAALKDFLKWAMTDGQKDAASLDYAPLPKAVADANLKTIDGLK